MKSSNVGPFLDVFDSGNGSGRTVSNEDSLDHDFRI